MKVIKRDGRIVDFDATKIERAILSAFEENWHVTLCPLVRYTYQ